MNTDYVTVKQVCERLHVSKATVHKWINSGQLAAVRAGRRVLIPLSAIEGFIRPVEPNEPIDDDEG